MIRHTDIGHDTNSRRAETRRLIASGTIRLGGYIPGKIYGRLSCSAGKRMKQENRIFFGSEQEAIAAGYRPCGHCMPQQYRLWKAAQKK